MASAGRQSTFCAVPVYDIAVIGGGINGTGIARDAAGRGAKVLLLERGDLAQGTSSASTKLIHGGLRYLEHCEFGLVREALSERERLWRIAPHIIHPMRFVLPYRPGLRPRWLLRLGLFLYDHIGGRRDLPATQTLDLRHHVAGAALRGNVRHGYAYSDGWVDDARLVVLNARDAADRGADVRVGTEVLALSRAGNHWLIETGQGQFHARAVVNAAGPSVLALQERAHCSAALGMRLVRGSHIVVPRLFTHDFAYFFQLADGRIVFAIPYERDFTLIGTTDRDHADADGPPRISEEEVRYLCDAANGWFREQISPADVVWSYSGVRPLIDDGSARPEAATRGYRIEMDGAGDVPPLMTIFGGKITTYRHLAEEAVDRLALLVPALTGKAWTADAPLPGGDFPFRERDALADALARDYPFLRPQDAARLAAAYGTLARAILGQARGWADLGTDFGYGLTSAEANYLCEREWARTADDILWRRTKLGLRLTREQGDALQAYVQARTAKSKAAGPSATR